MKPSIDNKSRRFKGIALLNVLDFLIITAATQSVYLTTHVGETVTLHCGRDLDYPDCDNTSRLSYDTDHHPVITNVTRWDGMTCECNETLIHLKIIGIFGLKFYLDWKEAVIRYLFVFFLTSRLRFKFRLRFKYYLSL